MQTTSMQILKDNKYKNLKGGFNMFKTMNKRIKNEKGLTLIELLAVIVILAIVAAIAVPAIGNIINNSEIKAVKADALNILNSANLYVTENPDVSTILYTPKSGSTAASWTITPIANSNATLGEFDEFIQSLGSFSEEGFTITNTAGTVSISTTDTISAGGKTITFSNAVIDNINADSATTDTNVTIQ